MSTLQRICMALCVVGLTACASQQVQREALDLIAIGEIEQGLNLLERAATESPDTRQRATYLAQKEFALYRLLGRAGEARQNGELDAAQATFERVLRIEPGHVRATEGLRLVARDRAHAEQLAEAHAALAGDDLARAQTIASRVAAESPDHPALGKLRREIGNALANIELQRPMLQPRYSEPITLAFRNASVAMVLEALSRSTGLSFVLDGDFPADLRTTIFINDARVEDAIELLRRTSRLGMKAIDANTVLVYLDTPDKAGKYEELLVKSFYLSNASAAQVQTSLRTLLKLQDVVVDEKINMLVLRDTPERIRLAERIIAMHDIPEPEVMLEVEVLEVSRSRLTDLGIQLPNQVTFSPLSAGGSGTGLTVDDLRNLNGSRVGVGIGPVTLNLRKELGDANVLANPRIRAKNRETAQILIGDRVPVITTTTTATGFAAESVQYLDVGLKLEVVPTVFFGDDVSMKVSMEVSSLGREVTGSSGSLAYQIGTRNASTTLQLRDGETQILAGLISDEERNTTNRIPGLGDIPIVGRLFSSQRDNVSKTEIVLSITPRIVRGLIRPDVAAAEFWSGTATAAGIRTAPARRSEASTSLAEPQTMTAAKRPQAETREESTSALTMSEPTSAGLQWLTVDAAPNQPLEVAVMLSSDGGLRNVPLRIAYDAEALQVVSVSEGDYFSRDNSESSFTHHIDAATGRIFISASRTGTDGARGEARVATIKLQGIKGQGAGSLRILSATAITVGDRTLMPALPAPLTLQLQ